MSVERPYNTFIVKLFSRCNLNCSYCYMYNLADKQYLHQPWSMTDATIAALATRIREHLDAHHKTSAQIILHGGEPLLGGAECIRNFFSIFDTILPRNLYAIRSGIQSNGILFDDKLGDLFVERLVTIGISLDGPPRLNDRNRVDHGGRGSSSRVERAISKLNSVTYRSIFGGFLTVVDIDNEPGEVYRYLAQFEPRSIDFLLPYDNHDRLPKGKSDFFSTPYGDWLIEIFNMWWAERSQIQIPEFDNIISMCLGGRSRLEAFGLEPIDIVVIETNGDIEVVDALKGAFDGATHLGYNVYEHSLNETLQHSMITLRRRGCGGLADTCRHCDLVHICGGGYLPNRYSSANGYYNPSIYCHDLQKIIRTIQARLST